MIDGFNKYFKGRILEDQNGNNLPAREVRIPSAFDVKFQTPLIRRLRKEMYKLLEGKEKGATYMPIITEEELNQYREDGTVVVGNPNDEIQDGALDAGTNCGVLPEAYGNETHKSDWLDTVLEKKGENMTRSD